MRLLRRGDDGQFSLVECSDNSVPRYAILSHTWGPSDDEVTYQDLQNGRGESKRGFRKLTFCSTQAARDGLQHFWVDTCCIDKSSSAELSEAINSMFRWYKDAERCYVYLEDVSRCVAEGDDPSSQRWKPAFRKSRWFTRGWTLQELIAPGLVEFFSKEGALLGNKQSLEPTLHEITGIAARALQGGDLCLYSRDERLGWANNRQTTRAEDAAYCLLGIFDIHMPLIYGEGKEKALRRLQKEIQESSRSVVAVLDQGTRHNSAAQARLTHYIPFPKNRYFVGRRDELDALKQKLMVDRNCQKMSIVGLGGTGKTQVALQFAYMVRDTWQDYSVFWLPALSIESFEQACADVARKLHIPLAVGEEGTAKELVKQYLSTGQAGKWLLVLDNADDPNILLGTGNAKGLVDYLPESEDGITIYTTRIQEVAVSLTRSDMLELGAMSRQDAIDFLEKSLIKKALLSDGAATSELLDELACLPLAIAQAAAYFNMNKMSSVAKYLQLLRSTEQDIVGLMSKEFRDDTRYRGSANAVATTWVVSFRQVRERDAAAADLLGFMSCVEWKAIPRSLLPRVQPEERMEEAIGTLCGYSFLQRREDNNQEEEWFDMHRLVHLATRIWTRKHGDAAEATEKTVLHVTKVFPSDDFENRAVWRAYLPHALRLLESLQDYNVEKKAELCLLVGRCLLVDGRIREAVKWLEKCCGWREGLDEGNADRLSSQHELAGAYEADGQVKKAVELLEHIVAVEEKVLEKEHPNRLASQHELARAYRADGQIKKAVELLEHIVTIEEMVLAEEHPSRLASQHTLAGAYRADGQVKKAVELLEHVVAVREQVLAEDHPDRLSSQRTLAKGYQADGQVKKAVELLEHVVAVREQVLVEEHPDRLASQHALAGAYRADRQVKKAVELLEHVVALREQVLAEGHPDRLASQHTLAITYEADGQVKKAVALLEHVVTVEEMVLAEEHPFRLVSQYSLAGAYLADRQVKKAVELLEHVVTLREQVLAEDHPDRLSSQHTLAIAYEADGQVKKAVELLEHVVAVEEYTLRNDDPSRLISVQALTNMRAKLLATVDLT